MRLIDADRLKNVIDRNFAHPDGFKQIVDAQPTAYDVDKIIKKIESKSIKNPNTLNAHCYNDALKNSVRIIEMGRCDGV